MNKLVSAAILALAASTSAFAANYKFEIDWAKKETLHDVVVMMCDDTFYDGAEVIVGGEAGKDYFVELLTDVTNGRDSAGCTLKSTRKRGGKTVYTFSVESSCRVQVTKLRKEPSDAGKLAVLELGDSC
jgi:hypothetical protein